MMHRSPDTPHAIRASLFWCDADPGLAGDGAIDARAGGSAGGAVRFLRDGVIVVRGGRIEAVGLADRLLPALGPDVAIDDRRGRLVVPGFVDTHVHYAQVDVIASHGTQLLDWLERHTFPEERRFADRAHAADAARFFVDRLLENGTTTALAFGTVHAHSAEALLEESARRGLRAIAGKVAMDRHCPDFLRDDAASAYADTRALLERWGRHDRLGVAITPRFVVTSSHEQMQACGRLAAEFPGAWIQSHVAENRAEVAWVRELFPEHRSYLDVYDAYGLLRERAVYAHGIWLDDADRARLAASGAAIAHCPTSNLFLGSGLYDLAAALDAGHPVGLATDVGGGTSYSMLRTLGACYEVQQMAGRSLHPAAALHRATLGGAQALRLADRCGRIAPGLDADLVALDPRATPLLARRSVRAMAADGLTVDDPFDLFFALTILGDDRAVEATWAAGEIVHRRAGT